VALRTFYRLALIIPFVALGLGALRSPYYVVGTVVWLSPDALLRLLVLYTLLAAWLWVQFGRRPATRWTALLCWAPLQLVILVLLATLVEVALRGAWRAAAEFAAVLLTQVLLLTLAGYAYVVFLVLVRETLRRVGVMPAETARAGA
jgi:hypothetical protein